MHLTQVQNSPKKEPQTTHSSRREAEAVNSLPWRAHGSRSRSPPPTTTYLLDGPAKTGSARNRIRKSARADEAEGPAS